MENPYIASAATRRKQPVAQIALRTLFALALCLALPMCRQRDLADDVTPRSPQATKERQDQLKREFAKALVKVLANEQGARQLIKTEALKQFNHDYDVLYHMVKNQPVRDGLTFRQALQKAIVPAPTSDAARTVPLLEEIERELPLLTILVPELPENSFSAEKWDVATQLPLVGLRIWSEKGVPIITMSGEEDYLPFEYTPGFPVVVVKDNERVTVAQNPDELTFKAEGNSYYFRFTHENFDNLHGKRDANKGARWISNPSQRLLDAASIMNPIDGWQRDHIYYNLTPSRTKGPFSLSFRERIITFRFFRAEDYGRIADQPGDAKYSTSPIIQPASQLPPHYRNAGWTEGEFEFMVNAIINSRVLGLPAISPSFGAKGSDLFFINYREVSRFMNLKTYEIESITPNEYYPVGNVDLVPWDLDKYAPSMYITFKEMDISETRTITETGLIEFAANFEIDANILQKVGLKFGASLKKSLESTRTTVLSLDSDDLSGQIVEFGEKVIMDPNPPYPFLSPNSYRLKEYSTGRVGFTIAPMPN